MQVEVRMMQRCSGRVGNAVGMQAEVRMRQRCSGRVGNAEGMQAEVRRRRRGGRLGGGMQWGCRLRGA